MRDLFKKHTDASSRRLSDRLMNRSTAIGHRPYVIFGCRWAQIPELHCESLHTDNNGIGHSPRSLFGRTVPETIEVRSKDAQGEARTLEDAPEYQSPDTRFWGLDQGGVCGTGTDIIRAYYQRDRHEGEAVATCSHQEDATHTSGATFSRPHDSRTNNQEVV